MINLHKINELIRQDQELIKQYTNQQITLDEWKDESRKVSLAFLQIINGDGFYYMDVVPDEIYRTVITLSLHLDLIDMKKVFDKYIENASLKQVKNEHRVMFIDKIRILSGKQQLYGTQYKKINGKIELLPTEDIDNLDNRRKELGLPDISDYFKTINY